MNKYVFWGILFISLLIPKVFSAWVCEYSGNIDECVEANKSWSPLAIEDYICIQDKSTERIAYQIVLDKKFSLVDEEIEDYLTNLEKDKDYYFWKAAISDFLEAINDIWKKLWKNWYYWEKYKNYCTVWKANGQTNDESIQAEVFTCLWWTVSIANAKDFFRESDCMWLAELKLELYEDVAHDILTLNKHYVRQDEKKLFIQTERWKYDEIVELFMINIWYVEKIWRKWPSVTPVAK